MRPAPVCHLVVAGRDEAIAVGDPVVAACQPRILVIVPDLDVNGRSLGHTRKVAAVGLAAPLPVGSLAVWVDVRQPTRLAGYENLRVGLPRRFVEVGVVVRARCQHTEGRFGRHGR